jgi:hypothetical protein
MNFIKRNILIINKDSEDTLNAFSDYLVTI